MTLICESFQEFLASKQKTKAKIVQLRGLLKNILPNGLQAALIVKYRLSPSGIINIIIIIIIKRISHFPCHVIMVIIDKMDSGKVVLSIIQNLQYSIAYGKSPILRSVDEVLCYIEESGGVDRWINERVDKKLLLVY